MDQSEDQPHPDHQGDSVVLPAASLASVEKLTDVTRTLTASVRQMNETLERALAGKDRLDRLAAVLVESGWDVGADLGTDPMSQGSPPPPIETGPAAAAAAGGAGGGSQHQAAAATG
jgi:hypothetical protein